jgi:hypothetical protein
VRNISSKSLQLNQEYKEQREYSAKKCVHIYVNAKMVSAETTLGVKNRG